MPTPTFHCPNCDKAYGWQRAIAGRRVRCRCGQKFLIPLTADGLAVPDGPLLSAASPASPEPEAQTYELNLPEPKPPSPPAYDDPSAARGGPVVEGRCRSCNLVLRPGAVICLNCGFDQAQGARLQTVVEPSDGGDTTPAARTHSHHGSGGDSGGDFEDEARARRAADRVGYNQAAAEDLQRHYAFQEKTLPLILIGVGVLLALVNAFVLAPILYGSPISQSVFAGRWGVSDSVSVLIESGILFLIQLPCLLVGVLVIAKVFGTAFGELFTALTKLAAIALVFGQFSMMLDLGFDIYMGGFGFIAYPLKLSLNFIVFWGVSVRMFDDMELSEVVSLWIMLLILPAMVFVLLLMVL